MLEFLFVGPLFSIFKALNELRKDIMGLADQLTAYGARVDAATAELSSEFASLRDALANAGQVDPAVQAAADSLGEKISALESLETPNHAGAENTGGPSVLPPVEPVPDETTVASPGEPISELPDESQGSPGEPTAS